MPLDFRCPKCGYALPGEPANAVVCPECGGSFTYAELVHEAQRPARRLLAVKSLLFVAVLAAVTLGTIKLLAWLLSI